MGKPIPPEGYLCERLDNSAHSRKEFSCGKPPLDDFLKTQASQAQGKYLSATHVLVESSTTGIRPIVGYITLLTCEIPLAECPPTLSSITTKKRLPAMLLARMAVDSQHKHRRLGEYLLRFAFQATLDLAEMSGCFLLAVDAKDDESVTFYRKYDFDPLPDNPKRLFIPTSILKKAADKTG